VLGCVQIVKKFSIAFSSFFVNNNFYSTLLFPAQNIAGLKFSIKPKMINVKKQNNSPVSCSNRGQIRFLISYLYFINSAKMMFLYKNYKFLYEFNIQGSFCQGIYKD